MKKLNRKGFTLIELLAIIVILAIIMVVTIPTVLGSMGNAREEMYFTSANTVADWVEKQYTQAMLQQYDEAFIGFCTQNKNYCGTTVYKGTLSSPHTKFSQTNNPEAYNFLKAAGVDPENYAYLEVHVDGGRACVRIGAAAGGDFDFRKGTSVLSTGC